MNPLGASTVRGARQFAQTRKSPILNRLSTNSDACANSGDPGFQSPFEGFSARMPRREAPMIRTRITEMFGIQNPILCGAMM